MWFSYMIELFGFYVKIFLGFTHLTLLLACFEHNGIKGKGADGSPLFSFNVTVQWREKAACGLSIDPTTLLPTFQWLTAKKAILL